MDCKDSPVTKRQLGKALALLGGIGFICVFAIDILDVGRQGGIGPAQSIALLILAAVCLVGISLIPLGDKPA